MYTGIVQGLEKVVNIQQGDNFTTLYISNENGFLNDVFIGASVAIDG
ncbi:MAG: riboflavin synthase, partial [Acinetobacter sp.]|nr:riboflavin synthase [Acinetobacter sp.]